MDISLLLHFVITTEKVVLFYRSQSNLHRKLKKMIFLSPNDVMFPVVLIILLFNKNVSVQFQMTLQIF